MRNYTNFNNMNNSYDSDTLSDTTDSGESMFSEYSTKSDQLCTQIIMGENKQNIQCKQNIHKQNYHKPWQDNLQCKFSNENHKIYRDKIRTINNVSNSNHECLTKSNNEIGYDSGFNKNTPFINYLINKRIGFCKLGASSHIAAFVPVSCTSRYCFIREWKGKDHYG